MSFIWGGLAFAGLIGWYILDLPDPRTLALSKLYTVSFYRLALSRLSASGVLVTQATSPLYAAHLAAQRIFAQCSGEDGQVRVRDQEEGLRRTLSHA